MIPLRLVLDTNIVVSAALSPQGLSRSVLVSACKKPAKLYLSTPILDEYRSVLARPEFSIRKGLQRQLLDLLTHSGELLVAATKVRAAHDPADDIFLECADAARADYLITGNARHFPKFWKATKIVTAREFIEIIGPHLIR